MSNLIRKHRSDLLSILFGMCGIFILLSLASYSPQDPSFSSTGTGIKPINLCGYLGGYLADLLFQIFGVMAFAVGAGCLWAAYLWGKFRESKQEVRWYDLRWMFVVLAIFILAPLLSLNFKTWRIYGGNIPVGGALGLASARMLERMLNTVGAQIVLWSGVFILAVLATEVGVWDVIRFSKKLWSWAWDSSRNGSDWLSETVRRWAEDYQKFKNARKPQESKLAKQSASGVLFDTTKEGVNISAIAQDGNSAPSEGEVDSSDLGAEPISVEDGPERASEGRRKVVLKVRPPKKIAHWEMPKIGLLEDPPASRLKMEKSEIQRKADLLVDKLQNFDVQGQIVDAKPGPLVTMFEFKPNADVKISKIGDLEDDLSLALSSESVRVVGHIPGTDVVGIETANLRRETVYYKDLIAEAKFWSDELTLPMALGRQVDGEPKIVDLRKMPHLLIAGTTGSGKSVLVGSIITGLLFRHSPKTLRLILVDPKMVDLAAFSRVPHLALPHITEAKKAVSALRWAVREMEKRYRSLSQFGAAKIEIFNEKVANLSAEELARHEKVNADYEADSRLRNESYYFQPLPFIVIVVDELADLMVTEKQQVEQPIQRLTQMARACGMHLILATQSPRKDVVTGLIKTNIPGRIALKVASKMDSRIILDDSGAERLLPNGDMLFLAPGIGKPTRHHGPYLSDTEIHNVVNFWAEQGEPEYDSVGMKILDSFSGGDSEGGLINETSSEGDDHDEKYDEILSWASDQKEVSASLIQRRFRLGYPRAARLIEIFEKEGVVGPANGSKPRQVLVRSYSEGP